MKILVTGGTVFVSKYVAEYFVNRNCDIFVLNRNTRPQVKGASLIECDRRAINGKLKNHYFDAVIDVNAYTARDVDLLLNELGGFGDYVMISSSAVYPDSSVMPVTESASTGKNKFWGDYGLNKISAENILRERVPEAYILRPPYLYGEYNNIYREAFVFECAEKDKPFYLPGNGDMRLQFFHIDDLCRLIELILKIKPEQKIFNTGNAPVTVKSWVEACYSVVGKAPVFKEVYGDEQRNYFPFYDYEYELNVTKQNGLLRKTLPLEKGLARAYAWFKDNRSEVKSKNYFDYIEKHLK